MPLQAGEKVPAVTLLSHDLQKIELGGAPGRPQLVLFFPLAFTSTCTEEMCTVSEDFAAYEQLNADVYAVSVDSPFALQRFRAECAAEFPFLSDFDREASITFGVLRTQPLRSGLRNTADRAAFVIGADGVVMYAWHSDNPGDLPPFGEIKEALRTHA